MTTAHGTEGAVPGQRPVELLLAGPGRLLIRPLGPPAGPAPGEVMVRVDRVGLCGSDYRLYQGTYGGPCAYPLRFGHEWAGEVVAAGPGAGRLLGRTVTGDCSRWCGRCDRCRTDRNLCRSIEKFGLTTDGFSSRYVHVPARYLYPDPHGLPPDLLALTELFAVALRGLRKAPAPAAAPVLVIGAGPLGLAVRLLATSTYPASRVHLLESDRRKVETLARRVPGLVWHAPEETPAPGGTPDASAPPGYPLVVDCAGAGEPLNTALRLTEPGSTVVYFGLQRTTGVRCDLLTTKGLTVLGSVGGTGAFPEAMRFLSRHVEEARLLLTHRYPAHQAAEALRADAGSRIKTQLLFDH
ncbi:zinc-binding dehydrogenase [Streptomyces mobaraensis NBRC 13819 = DSM 40847]|uniref:zinc-dependent alcohol dehydrogenase n=1 Tax=Streptomyces mobaraensis TaxID=35621 RepID=UPI001319E4BA|nr:zinc-binding dehydrogenase [Streptomyces mobaraensis]QTT72312.1 zinc-binding dehydrogenase [Streptomyces mobaraensis NBRC 13819 = DSM 40847]